MAVVVVGTEKNFAALRPRLFEGKVSSKAAGSVAEQVRKANPHANLDKLKPGTVLVIPDSAEVQVRGDLALDEPTTEALKGIGEHGKSALDELVAGAERQEEHAREARARAIEALDAAGTGTRRPAERGIAKKDFTQARKALAEEDARAAERADALKRAQAEWADGLDSLTQRLSALGS